MANNLPKLVVPKLPTIKEPIAETYTEKKIRIFGENIQKLEALLKEHESGDLRSFYIRKKEGLAAELKREGTIFLMLYNEEVRVTGNSKVHSLLRQAFNLR